MRNPPTSLTLHRKHWDQILADVESRKTEEACGLIAGLSGVAEEVIPVSNQYHSLERYRMDPSEQLKAFERIEQQDWQLLAIYHSHPKGPSFPSATDIAEAAYPGIINLIISPNQRGWIYRGFLIEGKQVTEVPISIIDDDTTTSL
ncbi:MAG: M67 family metallopeptidase [Anaerolineales bacterium]|nr:M67 family metallopeptidase [Anaerolineales bacterium]